MRQFYTYLWLREDGTPYYVGKGSNSRAYDSRRGHRPPKDHSRILLQEHPSEADAFASEVFFIAYYGREDTGTGCLINHTDGGDNPPNATGSKRPDNAARNTKLLKGVPLSPEHRAKLSAAKKGKHPQNWGKKSSAITIAKLRLSHLGKPGRRFVMSDAQKLKLRAARLGKPAPRARAPKSEETKQKLRDARLLQKPHSAEVIEKCRQAALQQWSSGKGHSYGKRIVPKSQGDL